MCLRNHSCVSKAKHVFVTQPYHEANTHNLLSIELVVSVCGWGMGQRENSPMTRITNHSDSLRLDGAELERLNELYDEAKRGRHRDVIDLREDLKHAPEAPSAEHRGALEREGRECMVQAADTPAWSRHFARLRDRNGGGCYWAARS